MKRIALSTKPVFFSPENPACGASFFRTFLADDFLCNNTISLQWNLFAWPIDGNIGILHYAA
jgi:hypothetical protein